MSILMIVAVSLLILGALLALPAMALEMVGVISFDRAEPFVVAGQASLFISMFICIAALGAIFIQAAA